MIDRVNQFLTTADSPDTRDLSELKALYKLIEKKSTNCKNEACIAKMLLAVRKYQASYNNDTQEAGVSRKYTLKPGLHSFAPRGPADHHNGNTTDEEIEIYLKLYPHIKTMLTD